MKHFKNSWGAHSLAIFGFVSVEKSLKFSIVKKFTQLLLVFCMFAPHFQLHTLKHVIQSPQLCVFRTCFLHKNLILESVWLRMDQWYLFQGEENGWNWVCFWRNTSS